MTGTIRDALRDGKVILVNFKKLDGSERIMRATTNKVYLIIYEALPKKKSSTVLKKPNEDIIKVYDLGKQAWRSIREDRIVA